MKSFTTFAFVLVGLALTGTAPVARATNLLADGSFEAPPVTFGVASGFPGGSAIGSWQALGIDVLLINNPSEPDHGISNFNAQDGLQAIDLTGAFNTGLTDGVSQDVITTPGTAYLISFWVGTAQANNGYFGYQTPATDDLSIDGGPRISFTTNIPTNPGFVVWQNFTYEFTAVNATTNISFFNGELTNYFAGLDNVSVDAVPEPGSLTLLALGGVVLLPRRRSQR